MTGNHPNHPQRSRKSGNSTNSSRAARRLAKLTVLTYAQALDRLRRAGWVPNLDDPTAVADFIVRTTRPAPDRGAEPTSSPAWSPAALAAEVTDVGERLDLLLDEWDATDEVGTDLGVDVENLGSEIAGLLEQMAECLPAPGNVPALRATAATLAAAVAHYAAFDEHDTSASIDIVDQLGPALGALFTALTDAGEVSCAHCAMPIRVERTTATSWTHVERGGRSGGYWCNPDFTRDNEHTGAYPARHQPAAAAAASNETGPADDTHATGGHVGAVDEVDDVLELEEEEEEEEGEEESWRVCHFCGRNAGTDYHLADIIPTEENNVVCDDCWDERLR